ncbi:MAG: excinuclease ABC subunit UvrA [Acidobacteriota bacterium]
MAIASTSQKNPASASSSRSDEAEGGEGSIPAPEGSQEGGESTSRERPVGAIEVVGARTHNLKEVSCFIPHGKVTVVTGPSGAGKSSLAFDTVYAEGQRRFVESMSTYARQFLQQMERPPLEALHNVPPPVALEATNRVNNARSTVGTLTEVQDVLRLLFAHLGSIRCTGPKGGEDHGPVRRYSVEQASQELASGRAGARFLIVAPVARPPRKSREALAELVRQGFGRRLREGEDGPTVERLTPSARWLKADDPMPFVLGRFRATAEVGVQLASAVEDAYRLAGDRLWAVPEEPPGDEAEGGGSAGQVGQTLVFSSRLGCVTCGRTFLPPTPALFSFNSPLGACGECQGFGRVVGIDPLRVIPDPSKTLAEKPIACWNTPSYQRFYQRLFAGCQTLGIPLDVPWQDLAEPHRELIWNGPAKGRAHFTSVQAFFQRLERRTYRVHVRVLLARYRSYDRCPRCDGRRLGPEARAVEVAGATLPHLISLSVDQLRQWLQQRRWSPRQRELAGPVLEQLEERVEVLHRVGLGYLSLDRQARTLSGGETQRIHLAAALGSGLTTTLYVLDEPTIGLHPNDSEKLLSLLRDLSRRGNTVLVVEHDPTLIEGADHLIDLGPRAGEYGGQLITEGPPEVALEHAESLTARYLRRRPRRPSRGHLARFRRERGQETESASLRRRPQVTIRGASENNLKNVDVTFPRDALVAVTGVSGSGKSTLVERVLYGTYQRSRGVVDVEPGQCEALEGLDSLADLVLVDQRPLGRSSRSNPVTYIKAYDDIRKLFAAQPEAAERGITAGHFSFNLDRGRCPVCQGTGVVEVDMHFMAPVTVSCEECQGRRFRDAVLGIRAYGRNIAEVLELTVDEAIELFSRRKRLARRLQALVDVGLGYLRLGQPTSTLSGGEAQRLKLASFLDRPAKGDPSLFVFDEPTTGLHLADIDLLYQTLRRLVQRGDGVVVVEHSLELIERVDWVVELGPEGGIGGGELLFSGPMDDFLRNAQGPTAKALRKHLR